jgi:hypothetical protein
LTASDAQNLLTLRKDNDGCFSNAAAANTIRRYADNMFTGRNENLDLFRWGEICNWHRVYEDATRASRTHETAVTLDDEAAGMLCLR